MAAKKRKPTAKAVLAAADKIESHGDRAKFLEAALDRVDKPEKLVDALFKALDAFTPRDDIGAKLTALVEGRDVAVLEAVGKTFDNYYMEEYAGPVLQMAVAAGSTNTDTLELLGRLLVLQGDASGVPLLERVIDVGDARIALATYLHDKDPERALATIEECTDWKANELRAMIHEAGGRKREAKIALDRAIEEFGDELSARKDLADWHYDENRYARSLVHARVMFELRKKRKRRSVDYDLDELDESIARAFRLGGAFEELVPWLRERCAKRIPSDLAWHIYYGLTSREPPLEPALAIRAAEACMKKEEVPSDKRAWRVRIASVQGVEALEALARDGLDDDSAAWVALADAYHAVDAYDAASAALDRAIQLDPNSPGALSTMFDLARSAGDVEMMSRASEALAAAKPQWHQGPEHLARTYARRGEAELARTHARRAAQLAPYCQNAWIAVAEACVVGGDLDGARQATKRSLQIDAATEGDDISILHAALFGDAAALDRALAARYKHLPALPFPKFVAALRQSLATRT